MDNYIITIARGYGSGGQEIAKKLSRILGIKYYDRELIRKASDKTGVNEALFNLADETHKKNPFRKYTTQEVLKPDDTDYLSKENLFNMQAQVIREIAEQNESCVIVGRCAHHILKDNEAVVRVYIHADYETCIENIKERNGVTDSEAAELIDKFDTERAQYHKYFTNMEWNDIRNYDLSLNTSKADIDKCVKIIISYLHIMQGLEK